MRIMRTSRAGDTQFRGLSKVSLIISCQINEGTITEGGECILRRAEKPAPIRMILFLEIHCVIF